MALASFSPGYTAPANIRAYRHANRFLPRQWAAPGDLVWDGEEHLAHLFAEEASAPEICPWGWSPALVHELRGAGVPDKYLPSRDSLERLRQLSSRISTWPVQKHWGMEVRKGQTLDEVEQAVAEMGRVVMKSPWSSSGKGLMQTDNPNWRGWVGRILSQQGVVMVEKWLPRRQDFAMEFWLRGHRAEYMGLNVFRTDDHGHFLENVQIEGGGGEALISSLLADEHRLAQVRGWYEEQLPQMAPLYEGPVGVDMMVTVDGCLLPCIEINWRMTMGMASVLVGRRHLQAQ